MFDVRCARTSPPGLSHRTLHIEQRTLPMSHIHPTAVIDAAAELADDVVIGPYCVVGPHVKIGPATQLMSHVVVTGRTSLGAANRIWYQATLGGDSHDLKYRGEPTELIVGDRNDVREYVTMHIGTANGDGRTTVGDDNLLMVGAHIAHDSHIGDHCVLANNVMLAGHITIEDFAVVSGGAALHHFVTVGRYAFVGGNAGVVHDCPPYMVSDGHPARVRAVNTIGLQRHGFDEHRLERLKHLCRTLYRRDNGHNQAQVIHAMAQRYGDDPACREVCAFARRAADAPNARHRESLRRDDKRATPTR